MGLLHSWGHPEEAVGSKAGQVEMVHSHVVLGIWPAVNRNIPLTGELSEEQGEATTQMESQLYCAISHELTAQMSSFCSLGT